MNSYTLTPAELVKMMLDQFERIDNAQKRLEVALKMEAGFNNILIKARANAWREVQGPNREYREALVDEASAEQLVQYQDAQNEARVSLEAVRNERQKLSALQSAANSIREEAALARVGPDMTGVEMGERLGKIR